MKHEELKSMFDEAKVLSLKKGDVLVFRTERHLHNEERELFVSAVRGIRADVDVMVLDGGLDLSVIRFEDIPK